MSNKKKEQKKLRLIVDTREQTPLRDWPENVEAVTGTLKTGDYSVEGFEQCFAVERKSLDDFAGTLCHAFEANTQKPLLRFNRELERLRHYDLAAVVVVGDVREAIGYKFHSGADSHHALWDFALSIFATYRVPVFFMPDARLASRFVADLARHYVNVRTKKHFAKADASPASLGRPTPPPF